MVFEIDLQIIVIPIDCINLDNSFTCNMGLCIPGVTVYCNGTKKCPDGSDEPPGCQTSRLMLPYLLRLFHSTFV